ncbi:MAG: NADP-dependent phosphogluconate dehydrogenase, partial [Bacteroidetes bacterium]
ERRSQLLAGHGIHFLGTGVSGGEAGALNGPSIMPGGSKPAYTMARHYLEAIAAQDKNGNACCGYIGKGGSGHFVKMVHNGIEYAEMQFIAELYGAMRHSLGYPPEKIADVFESWLSTPVTGYLLEIAVDILRKKEGEMPMVDLILDKAGNKGTGSWTTIAACELGVPVPTLSAALFARYQSAFKQDRTEASSHYAQQIAATEVNEQQLLTAYQTARIINHHQGFDLINVASETYGWDISLSEVSRIWTDGCILRSALAEEAAQLFLETSNLLLHPEIISRAVEGLPVLRQVVANISLTGAAIPCLSSALSYFEIFSKEQSTANIIQALRDYFGAHRFQRKDDPDGPFHHINWTS